MSDLPKLVVTREQAKTFGVGVGGLGASRVVLRLPDRPTMPCPRTLDGTPVCQRGWAPDLWCDGCQTQGVVSIPEGERVEVGYPCPDPRHPSPIGGERWHDACDNGWHPVATATLAEVRQHVVVTADSPVDLPQLPWVVTLTDVEACHE